VDIRRSCLFSVSGATLAAIESQQQRFVKNTNMKSTIAMLPNTAFFAVQHFARALLASLSDSVLTSRLPFVT